MPFPDDPMLGKLGPFAKYAEVPWYRRSATNTAFIILHLLTCGFIPFLLITCIVLLTGDIYYEELEPDGSLRKWSNANKIIAFVLLLGPVILIGSAIISAMAGLQ
jgi:hypothetical protein